MPNQPCKTTKMARNDINQDHLDKEDQQRTDDSPLNLMMGVDEHEGSDISEILKENTEI